MAWHRHPARRLWGVVSVARADGGQYLSDDLKSPPSTSRTWWRPQQLGGSLQAGHRAAARHLHLRHGAGRLGRRQDGDLLVGPRHDHADPEPVAVRLAAAALPARPKTQVNFNDLGFYAMSSKTPDKDLPGKSSSGGRTATATPIGRTTPAPTRRASTPSTMATANRREAAPAHVPPLPEVQLPVPSRSRPGRRSRTRRGADPGLLRRQDLGGRGRRQRREDREAGSKV